MNLRENVSTNITKYISPVHASVGECGVNIPIYDDIGTSSICRSIRGEIQVSSLELIGETLTARLC